MTNHRVLGPQFSVSHVSSETGWDPGASHMDMVEEGKHTASLESIPLQSVEHWSSPVDEKHFEHEVPYVRGLTGMYKSGRSRELPPIVTYRDNQGNHHVEDGWHRISAAKEAGNVKSLPAYVFNHTPRDAYQHDKAWVPAR